MVHRFAASKRLKFPTQISRRLSWGQALWKDRGEGHEAAGGGHLADAAMDSMHHTPGLVNVATTNWKITMFNGKINSFYGIYGYMEYMDIWNMDSMEYMDMMMIIWIIRIYIYIYKREMNISGWWLTYPSEKYESQLGWLFPIYGK